MTARKPSSQGRPLRSFLFCELPSPRPRKWDLREVPLRGKGSRPPREKRGGCLIRRGQPAPAGDWGTALPGWACSRGSLRIPPSKGDLREVPLRGKGSRPHPEENGEGVSFAGGSLPLPGIGEPPCRAGPVPGELENALPSKGDLREVSLRGRGSHPPPRKTGRVSHSPEEARPCRELGNRPAGLGLFQGSLRMPCPRKVTCGKCLSEERGADRPREKRGGPCSLRKGMPCCRLEVIPPGWGNPGVPAAVYD